MLPRKRRLFGLCIFLLELVAFQGVEAFAPLKWQPGSSWHSASEQSDVFTSLKVSELHVPGYSESKIPFILKEDDLVDTCGSSGSLLQKRSVMPRSLTPQDFGSLIPFQDGYLLHRTKDRIFSAEECERMVEEAEKVASEIEWTPNRHGNFPTTDLPLVDLPATLKF